MTRRKQRKKTRRENRKERKKEEVWNGNRNQKVASALLGINQIKLLVPFVPNLEEICL